MRKALLEHVDKVLPMPPFCRLAAPVHAHPDMLLWVYGKEIVTYGEYRYIAKDVFEFLREHGYSITETKQTPSDTYPNDVFLNCAVVGDHLIANKKTISEEVAQIARRAGLSVIHTNQGYTKCSVAVVGDNAIITSDVSIHRAVSEKGMDSLLISPEGVGLDGYGYGFIGGATGSFNGRLLVCGDIFSHSDGKAIDAFCRMRGVVPTSLSNDPLYDFGTVTVLEI